MSKQLPLPLADTLPASDAATRGRRGAARARLALPGRAVSFDGSTRCTIIDVSRTGAQIACEDRLRRGAMVVVEMPAIEFFGTVTWAIDGRFGMQFDEPISQEEVVTLRRQADTSDNREELRALRLAAQEFVQGRL